MTKEQARILYEHYDNLIKKLMAAQLALVDGGVQSYTIDDRSLTRFDLPKIDEALENAVKKRSECQSIMNGKGSRKAVGVVPRDI